MHDQNRNPIRPESKTEKGYDFLCDNRTTKISVKTITHENKAGSTTKLNEPWDELILITINEKIQVERFGILTKKQFKIALEKKHLKSEMPYARRTMVGPNGLITLFGTILPVEITNKYF